MPRRVFISGSIPILGGLHHLPPFIWYMVADQHVPSLDVRQGPFLSGLHHRYARIWFSGMTTGLRARTIRKGPCRKHAASLRPLILRLALVGGTGYRRPCRKRLLLIDAICTSASRSASGDVWTEYFPGRDRSCGAAEPRTNSVSVSASKSTALLDGSGPWVRPLRCTIARALLGGGDLAGSRAIEVPLNIAWELEPSPRSGSQRPASVP
jgi:hypothetical protein